MKKIVVVLCAIIIIRPSGYLQAENEGRDNNAIVATTLGIVADVLEAASIKANENATSEQKAKILSDIVKKISVMTLLMGRQGKISLEFFDDLQKFCSTQEGRHLLEQAHNHLDLIETYAF